MSIQDWFDKYGESHQNQINKKIHWICVPAIFFSLVGLLSLVPLKFGSDMVPDYLQDQMHLGTLLIVFGIVFFIRLSRSIALGMLVISVLILKGITSIHHIDSNAFLIFIIIFSVAWVGQFIGHKIEGKKPSFFDDIQFLLIGPAWLLSFIYKKFGIKY